MDRITQDFGFGILPKQVMKENNLSLQSKGIYAYLCAYAGNKDTAFPSISLITYELGISKDTFYKYMNELKDKKYIETFQEKQDNGKFSHSIYKLLPCPKSSDTVSSDTVSSYTVNKDTNINSIKKNSIKKNNSNLHNKDTSCLDTSIKDNKNIYTQDFETWFCSYPNQFNKELTFRSWKKLLKTESIENVIASTKEYKKEIKSNGTEKKYLIKSTNFVGEKQQYKGYLKESTPQTIKPKFGYVEVEV